MASYILRVYYSCLKNVIGIKSYDVSHCFGRKISVHTFFVGDIGHWLISKALSTLIRFQTKTELYCSGFFYRPHCNAENNHRKRSHSKTLSRVERFENDAFFSVDGENDAIWKRWRHQRPLNREYPKWQTNATMWLQFRGPIYWNAHASSSLEHAHWEYKSVFITHTAL